MNQPALTFTYSSSSANSVAGRGRSRVALAQRISSFIGSHLASKVNIADPFSGLSRKTFILSEVSRLHLPIHVIHWPCQVRNKLMNLMHFPPSWPFASQISLVRTDTHAIQARQVRLAALAIPPHNRLMALLLRWADYRDTFKLLYISFCPTASFIYLLLIQLPGPPSRHSSGDSSIQQR